MNMACDERSHRRQTNLPSCRYATDKGFLLLQSDRTISSSCSNDTSLSNSLSSLYIWDLEHLHRVRYMAYQMVRDMAYNEVRSALVVMSSNSRTLDRVCEDQNSACLTNFGTYYFVVVFLFFLNMALNYLCFFPFLPYFSDAVSIGRR